MCYLNSQRLMELSASTLMWSGILYITKEPLKFWIRRYLLPHRKAIVYDTNLSNPMETVHFLLGISSEYVDLIVVFITDNIHIVEIEFVLVSLKDFLLPVDEVLH